MDCRKADLLMMKHMDGTISKPEASRLNGHIAVCEGCAEAFRAYSSIVSDLPDAESAFAPDGFEEAVMGKVAECGKSYGRVGEKIDSFIYSVAGVVAVIFGLVLVVALNREAVAAFLSQSPAFSSYVDVISPFVNVINAYAVSLSDSVSSFVSMSAEFLANYRYFSLAAFILVLLVSYVVHRTAKPSEKSENPSDR